MNGIAVRILRDAAALVDLVPAWWALWRRIPQATPFQTPAWLLPWWRHFHPGDLFVIAAERQRRLIGLAPLYRESGSLGRRLIPLGIAVSDYHDILLDPAFAAEAGSALAEGVFSERDWDRLDLEELRPDAQALGWRLPDRLEEHRAVHSACPSLALAEDLAATVPKTKRRKLNLARNRAARSGPMTVTRAEGDAVATALDALFRLHGKRWAARGKSGVLSEEPAQRFHKEAARALSEAGLLRLHTLSRAGDVLAVQYGFHRGDESYAYLSGFDPEWEFESPGTLLLAHVIEAAIGEGAKSFQFLRGQESYKYAWGSEDRWNHRRTFLRRPARDAAA
jgi:CelD/BcsL family acetyltransferase involved in cellulose biosynthesis